jgi:hypothetical protein
MFNPCPALAHSATEKPEIRDTNIFAPKEAA